MNTQISNPSKYNIGQQARVIKANLACHLPPYIKLINQCKDENGCVTVQAVKEYDSGKAEADIGNLLGGVWLPMEALLF